jgi:integrative and conjugative element protein (TIGR02256 family)
VWGRSRRLTDIREAGHLVLPADLEEAIVEQADLWTPKETGGMLLGYRGESEGIFMAVVTGLIDAGPKAKRTRWRFEPDGLWQQQLLETAYEDSGRVTTYLGDWHSHPRGRAIPSATDRRTYAKVAAETDSQTSSPVVLIAAPDAREHLRAYTIDRHGRLAFLRIRR